MLEVLKPPYMARKLYLAWDQKIWDILPTKLKKLCLLHYSKGMDPNELSISFT